MIDKETGSISFDNGNIALHSKMSIELFKTTSLYKGGSVDTSYLIKDTFKICEKPFLVTVFFNDRKLIEVHLSEVTNGKTWSNCIEELETVKKKSHDQWLLSVLGEAPYIYTWGQVESVFDKKGYVSSIIIRY
ncbi:hypothetical protein [Bacillus alkalicellulosilyticus]|uniref:hypothetical protein n=1 Tax=Alkalihalobacterium alkalicellulosilyticum TaxID=1912214 RepID=UPI000997A509|nr:hypothetical protein [Bacillus alkalicellulosilyticus]